MDFVLWCGQDNRNEVHAINFHLGLMDSYEDRPKFLLIRVEFFNSSVGVLYLPSVAI